MSTTLRQATLKALRMLGVKAFRTRSGLGSPFLCHVGDFAGEVPFYNFEHSRAEIKFMAHWCGQFPGSLIFDVGANVGFVATQIAQAAHASMCLIIAFEPVQETFLKLSSSIRALGLQTRVLPICCAVSDYGGVCSLSFSNEESLYAQVRNDKFDAHTVKSLTWSSKVTLDSVVRSIGCKPGLLKIDVEGYEAHVLRGARDLLQDPEAPVICFELNPKTLSEVGSSVEAIARELRTYRFFYLDDFEGQKKPFGEEVSDLNSVPWTCNLVAVPGSVRQQQLATLFERS